MKVLLDVNVVLDTLLARDPWRAESDAIWAACDAGRLIGCMSAVTLPTVCYLVDKVAPRGKGVEAVDACLKAFTIVAVTRDTLLDARGMRGTDFRGQRTDRLCGRIRLGCHRLPRRRGFRPLARTGDIAA